ncbi:butyrophilin subfamily 1 member A1-like [Pleurodeles waltl]|uniref:butyrophilin subfamily 1 member A1-like n=1 Tax=Pleurodeles waltl TaxID=8319 RepID=UPI00370965B2
MELPSIERYNLERSRGQDPSHPRGLQRAEGALFLEHEDQRAEASPARYKKVKFHGPESEMEKTREKEVMATLKPEEMKKYKVMVTLDPDTAHPELLLSDGGRHVRRTDTAQLLPATHKRFTLYPCVLGSEGFTSGRHYWEVQLLDRGGWTVGVAADSVERKRGVTWSPEGGVWAVERLEGQYRALTFPETPLFPREEPLKLGVYLDYEEGRLSLHNADSMELLYTFPPARFTHSLFPFFRLWGHLYVGAQLRLV